MVSLRYFAPDAGLGGLVSSYYRLDFEDAVLVDRLRAELPQIRITTRGSGQFRYADGRLVPCPKAMLNGPTTGPVLLELEGPLTVWGVGLLPAGWGALIGSDAAAMANDSAPLDTVFGAAASDLPGRLRGMDDGAAVAALDALLLARSAEPHDVPLWFTALADDWLTSSPSPVVDDLVAASGHSARQVERLMRRLYGGAPKLLARKYRALQACVRLGNGDAHNWADAAGDAFYDQAHFIREFKSFVGMTPHRFALEMAPVMRLTVARRAALPSMPKLALLS